MLTANLACSSGVDEPGVANEPVELTEEAFRQELVNSNPASPLMTAVGLDLQGSRGVLLLGQLLEDAVGECMRSRGWEYDPQLLRQDVGVAWLPAMPREEFARTHGFGSRLDPVATSSGLVSEGQGQQDYLDSLSHSELEDYFDDLGDLIAIPGKSDGPWGCRGEASKVAAGGHFGAMDALFLQVQDEIESRAEYRAATDAYTACTQESGLAWLDIPSSTMYYGYEMSVYLELTQAQEIEAAVIDLECRYPWEVIARQIRHDIETPLVEANRDMIAEVRELIAG